MHSQYCTHCQFARFAQHGHYLYASNRPSFDVIRLTNPVQCVPSLNLSVIECSLGIICVSIPPLRPLAVRIFPQDKSKLNSHESTARSPMQTASEATNLASCKWKTGRYCTQHEDSSEIELRNKDEEIAVHDCVSIEALEETKRAPDSLA
jgi:hypothetical protein